MCIPVALVYFAQKKKDVPFHWMFFMFGAFIITCGFTHLIDVWTFYNPVYRFSAFMKVITALASLSTVIALIPTIPKALNLPGIITLNEKLHQEVKVRKKTEEDLQLSYSTLAKKMEDLETINARLEQEITTRKEYEEKLARQTRELEYSNKELEQFTYITSHDLRSPLINLRGFSDVLQNSLDKATPAIKKGLKELSGKEKEKIEKILESSIPKALGYINSAVGRIDNLSNAILELSRTGRRKLHWELIDTNKLVSSCIDSFRHQIDVKNVVVVLEEIPSVYADRVSVEQVFANIIDNAIKYLPPGPQGKISISGREEEEHVLFVIEDNGCGIAEHNMEKVFQVFRRIGKAEVPGEGMGMAYTKTIVHRHGGEVWCESTLDKGTKFYFTIKQKLNKNEDY